MSEKPDQPMQDLKPTVWIGKQGCSETMIDEIVAQLKKRTMIKVKWLQNAEVEPDAVADQAGATLVEVRGRTMVLARKGKTTGQTEDGPGKGKRSERVRMTAREKSKATLEIHGKKRYKDNR